MRAVSKVTAKEVFNIPNILCYIRILLIPFFSYILIVGTRPKDLYIGAVLIFISGITDFLDGFIARRFNMITELGKMIDPIADKLTQFMIAICFATKNKYILILVVIVFVKELFMGICCLILLKKDQKLDGAKWYGKVATAVFYAVMVAVLIFPINEVGQMVLISIATAFMLLSLGMYIREFLQMAKDADKQAQQKINNI